MSSPVPGVGRQVWRLAGPAIATSLLQTTVFLADRLMLGRFDSDALASMQVQGPWIWSLWGVFTGVLVGTVALVARSVGAGDRARARHVARAAIRVAAASGIVVGVLGLLALPWLPLWLGSAPEMARLAGHSQRYLAPVLLAFPAFFVATAAAMVLHGAGDTRTPFRIALASNALNVAVNLVAIFGTAAWGLGPWIPALGAMGAGLGSAAAFVAEAALLLWVLRRVDAPIRVPRPFTAAPPHERADARAALRDLLRVSGPAVLERCVVHGGFLLFAAVITALGPLAMAANQALVTIESICFMSADGFGVAAATVVGQRLGAGDPAGARRGGWLAAGIAVVTLTALGLLIWALGPWLLAAFVPVGAQGGAEARALVIVGLAAMPVLALAQPFMATGVVLAQGLRGAGDTRAPLVSAVVGGLLVRVGAAWWLGVECELGVVGIWWASTLDWIVRTLWLTAVFRRGRWAHVRL